LDSSLTEQDPDHRVRCRERPSHQEAYTSLSASSIRRQTEEARRSTVSHGAKTKTLLQTVNHNEKSRKLCPR